jgi:flagellar basal-body rod protein FlgB
MSDKLFGFHAGALMLRGYRANLLASNLANAETPRYKAQDIDFKATLQQEQSAYSTNLLATHAGHFTSDNAPPMGAELLFRNPYQPAIDGNTVDTQVEQAEFAKNSMQYEASLRFMNGRISGLMTAIKGE